jgi:hypothetical protein
LNDEKTFKREQKMVGRFELGAGECFVSDKNRTGHIRHQCRKTTVLSCHSSLLQHCQMIQGCQMSTYPTG